MFDFLTQRSTKHSADLKAPGSFAMKGHGGADYHLVDAFISAVAVSAAVCFFHVCLIYVGVHDISIIKVVVLGTFELQYSECL